MRLMLVILAAAASAACASAGAFSPRPFPKAPLPPVASGTPPASGGPAVPAAPASVTPDLPAASGPAPSTVRSIALVAVLTTAMDLRGIPYRLGGADTSGFDCSGLVQYVFARHGIVMPRTVVEQFVVGNPTTVVEPGDLVFFETIGSSASHVGIAIDDQSFVHAPNSRGVVRVERLDAPYWKDRFLGARRVF